MAKFVFYSFVLLLLCVILRASTGFPVNAEHHADCVRLFKNLLQNVSGVFNSTNLCSGIPDSDKVAIRSQSETVYACAPKLTQDSGCVFQRNAPFSETECWKNIMTDLVFYDAVIKFYLELYLESPMTLRHDPADIMKPTLEIIGNLTESCFQKSTKDDSAQKAAAQMWGSTSYDNRQEMCKQMRGFHIRAITMNRAIRYMSSGDHRN